MAKLFAILLILTATTGLLPAAEPLSPAVVDVLRRYRESAGQDPAAAEAVLTKYLAQERAPAVVFELAVLRARQKRPAAAVKLFREVVEADPDYPHARSNLGQLLVQLGSHKEAAAVLQEVVKQEGVNAHRGLLLGQCYLALGKPVAAEQSLRVALIGYPDDEQLKLSLAVSLYQQKRYAACEAAAREVLAANPGQSDAWALVANSRLLDRRAGAAIDALEAVTRMNPDGDARYLWALGDLYVQEGLPGPALATYRKAARRSKPDPERSLRVARLWLEEGELDAAVKLAEPLIKTQPAPAHFILGLAAKLQNKAEQAEKHLKEAAKLDPLNGEALIALGDLAFVAEDYTGAVSYYRSARTLEKWERPALEAEADALLRQGKLKPALEVLLILQQRHPAPHWDRLVREVELRLQ